MNLVKTRFSLSYAGIPRVSGGEPGFGGVLADDTMYSPRERG